MRIFRTNDSCTMAQYLVNFESQEEATMTDSELIDSVERFNFGGSVITRNHEQALFNVYID